MTTSRGSPQVAYGGDDMGRAGTGICRGKNTDGV